MHVGGPAAGKPDVEHPISPAAGGSSLAKIFGE